MGWGDKLGRLRYVAQELYFGSTGAKFVYRFMQIMCVVVTIGAILQTAAVNFGMFLAGRILAGIAVG